MTILQKIVRDKLKEVEFRKKLIPHNQLEDSVLFDRPKNSLISNLNRISSSGIIAEFKRRSPSKSEINQSLNVFDVAVGYEKAGASGMSILTDQKYFGGSIEDLVIGRSSCTLPILRKEFIIDPYQIIEAKAFGADVILLIASILDKKSIKNLSILAKNLNLEVILEVHNKEELQNNIMPSLDIIGVNNRDLKTFKINLKLSEELSDYIPNEFLKISESGISNVEVIKKLKLFGYKGFLIGENFMKSNNPGDYASKFINNLKK
jgi:indole-3-glycerol phosphate synthase